MGFTPEQARLALAATDTGLDVEAALESLLAAGGDVTSPEMQEQPEYPASPPRHRPMPREAVDPGRARGSGTSTPSNTSANFQADKLLAQASEIGLSMFTKANAFWNQGKELAQKAYEEGKKQAAASGPTPSNDGRPRWMQTSTPDLPDMRESSQRVPRSTSFRDDDDVREMDTAPRPQPPRRREPTAPSASTTAPAPQTNNISLFGEDAPTYISPHRRRPAPSNSSLAGLESPQPASRRPAPSPRPEPRKSRINIVIPETSPSAIQASVAARTKGTEAFKLGQYAEAEAAYTRAITSLPSNHILLTSLYTNRAAARLKTGDSGGAVGDCTTALKLMTVEDDMSKLNDIDESMTWSFNGVPGKLDLREQAVKALQRRAAGLEATERWDRARIDWERLSGLHWPQAQGRVKEEATRSAGRCRTMVNSSNKAATNNPDLSSAAPSRPPSKPRPRPVQRPSGPSKPSEASIRLKQAEAAQEAEDNEKIQLKDSVDARISNWKGGKEANLRALIASLDTVLWPELGWIKVGMHELVTPSQVKIRYTKAIAKVHPDKVCPPLSSVEPFCSLIFPYS
jgi:tetratricopeptide (TPR) repeat protein